MILIMNQMTVRIENKNYTVSIHSSVAKLFDQAIRGLQNGTENITAQKLLEAYIAKVIECENLTNELAEIDSVVSEFV